MLNPADCFIAVGTIGLSTRNGRKPSTLMAAARHNRRAIQAELDGRGHIDLQKVVLNKTIHGPKTAEGIVLLANSRMADAGVLKNKRRKDYVQAIEFLISLPPDATVDQDQFFGRCVEWIGTRFSANNILSADIHLDEGAPHCHVLVLPMEGDKWVGSSLVDRESTRMLRTLFQDEVAKSFGLKLPSSRLQGEHKARAARSVIDALEMRQDAICQSHLWEVFQQAIEHDPTPYLRALGIEVSPASVDHSDTVKHVVAESGMESQTSFAAAMPLQISAEKPMVCEPSLHDPADAEQSLQKDRNLSCVGITDQAVDQSGFLQPQQSLSKENNAGMPFKQHGSFVNIMNPFKQHPLSAAFPGMHPEEFQKLKDTILKLGVLNPITLYEGEVLDGWHRLTAATELAMPCPMVELEDGIDPVDFVIAQNQHRRHLTPSQSALTHTKLYEWKPAHRPNKSAVTADFQKSTEDLAKIAKVGTRTIEHAKAVIANGVPEVQNAVIVGTASIETAATIAKLPANEQVDIVAQGPKAMLETAKFKKKARKKRSAATTPEETPEQARVRLEADKLAEEAHGDFDALAELEAMIKENTELHRLIEKLKQDDQVAETAKLIGINEISTRRQNELMKRVNDRERELKFQANILRRICAALNETDVRKLAVKVEALVRERTAEALPA